MHPPHSPYISGATTKRHVLVVDDDADARFLAVEELIEFGFDVTEADDGESAEHQIVARRPDLVILDLGLPGIGGLDVLKWLRADGRAKQLRGESAQR